MSEVTMAAVCMGCDPRDTQANIEKATVFIKQAAEQGVDLIVFPEETITGFGFHGVREYSAEDKMYMHHVAELVPEGRSTETFAALAKQYDMYIVFGIAEALEDRQEVTYNTAVLVGPEGYVGKYRKTHLPVNERFYHYPNPGDFPVFDTKIGKIGIMVCYDVMFPEIARILAVKGAQIICCPTCWPNMKKDIEAATHYVYEGISQARAWENQVFMVVSDYAQLYCEGHSEIISPIPGKPLASTGFEEGMAVATADVGEQILYARSESTDGNDNLKDRKPALYRELVQADPFTNAVGGGAICEG